MIPQSARWRVLVTAAAILIGLLNPLACMLHCALLAQHASAALAGEQRSWFYCDLPAQSAAADSAAPDGGSMRSASSPTLPFFGGGEGLAASAGHLIPALALVAWGALCRRPALGLLAFPPLVPPPRRP